MLDRDSIRQTLTQLLEEDAGQSLPALEDSKKLREELGLDSVDVVSIVMQIERQYRIRLTQIEMQDLATVGDVLDLLQAKLAAIPQEAIAA